MGILYAITILFLLPFIATGALFTWGALNAWGKDQKSLSCVFWVFAVCSWLTVLLSLLDL